VAEAGFTTSRRGFNQDEVRAFLVAVAAEVGRLQERERQLEAELRELQRSAPSAVELDDDTVAAALGEETLRVLQTARESASQIKIRAEESAAQTLRDASDEANRMRQDAEVEAARKRQDSQSDAEAEVALAKQQGREMVNEARAYRERVLADLERRTKLARNQIDELVNGRDRLLQVFERARLVAVDVTSELKDIEGPDEVVNLSPTTGPVPLMVPASEPADAEADDAAADDVVVDDAGDADRAGDAEADIAADAVDADEAEADQPDVDDDADDDTDEPEAAPVGRDANVVSLFRDRVPETDDADIDTDDESTDTDKPDVEGIFERLRTETADDDAVEPADDAADEVAPEPTPFSRRDEAIVPLIVAGARKLKRVLADEQNLVLDALRHQEPVTDLDELLPDLDEHVGGYATALDDELLGAAAAGAGEHGINDTKTLRRKLGKAGALDGATSLLRSDLIVPLRDRLGRAVADGSGDNDDITKRVRAVYREWKTQHIDDQLDDVFRFAHGGGLSAMAEPGSHMIWSIDPSEPACPDCEDNSLAGPVAAGDPYPTGHTLAPAHSGCRCLTVPADQ
jgi:DivIVA domain-containing protein